MQRISINHPIFLFGNTFPSFPFTTTIFYLNLARIALPFFTSFPFLNTYLLYSILLGLVQSSLVYFILLSCSVTFRFFPIVWFTLLRGRFARYESKEEEKEKEIEKEKDSPWKALLRQIFPFLSHHFEEAYSLSPSRRIYENNTRV